MARKLLVVAFVTFLLSSMLVGACFVSKARCQNLPPGFELIIVERDSSVISGCSLFIDSSNQNSITSSFVDGKQVLHLNGVTDKVIKYGSAEQIVLENCQNITVKNYDFSNKAKAEIQLLSTNSSKILDCTVSIYLENSFYNNITGNNCVKIECHKASNNTFSGNTVTNSEGLDYSSGFKLYSSDYNNITGNIMTQNKFNGMQIGNSKYNFIAFNNLTYNAHAISIGDLSSNNTFYSNNVAYNHNTAVLVDNCIDNLFFENNFLANNYQVGGWSSRNIWDNGTIGNYWSDYNGTDENNDGIGDAPYSFDILIRYPGTQDPMTNYDNFPLMEPVNINVIPEFPTWTVLPLLITATLAAVLCKRRLNKNRRESFEWERKQKSS